jgi:Fungal N-terminal domain of STAND proteins
MVKDAAYNLEIRLQRIDEKITTLASHHSTLLEDSSIDLQDEKAVIMQCLRICERATSYIQSLQNEKPILQREALGQSAGDLPHRFEAQLLTQKTLTETRNKLVETTGPLQERLDSATFNKSPDRESEMLRLKEEIDLSKQCLEVCKKATNEVSSQKIHVIEEVIADNDCDLMVVTALADLFHAGGVKSKGRSMQLVGSVSDDAIREMSKDYYGNRFGALAGHLEVKTLPSIYHKDVNDDGT